MKLYTLLIYALSAFTLANSSIYELGPYKVDLISVKTDGSVTSTIDSKSRSINNPPVKPLIIGVPIHNDPEKLFPVLTLTHGFYLMNTFYRQLIQHISSHGYIVIAPLMYSLSLRSFKNSLEFDKMDDSEILKIAQSYGIFGSESNTHLTSGSTDLERAKALIESRSIIETVDQEIKALANIINWFTTELESAFSSEYKTRPNPNYVAIAGHSRGGKVAFGLALGLAQISIPIIALAGIDPVEGTSDTSQTPPPILNFHNDSLTLSYPTLLIGAGLSPIPRSILFPPCAPSRMGHAEFFNELNSTTYHFLALNYGHMDFLDDKTAGTLGELTYLICTNGVKREPLRNFTGGAVVAFLNSVIYGERDALDDLLLHPKNAPIPITSDWKHDDKVKVYTHDVKDEL